MTVIGPVEPVPGLVPVEASRHRSRSRSPRPRQRPLDWRSVSVFVLSTYVALTVVVFLTGILLTHVLDGSVGSWDEWVNRWLASGRAAWIDDVTRVATLTINTGPAVVIALVVSGVLALRRLWSDVATLLIGLLLEITVFLSTTFVVDRPRPHVVRLNSTPSTSSFPSGHTAAATVLFAGLALILGRHMEHRVVRACVWGLAVLVIALVAFSRVYRGLHHPTDVIAGVLYGVGCLAAGSQAAERSASRVRNRDGTARSPAEGASR